MNKKQRIALFILAIHFQPMIIGSDEPDPIVEQVDFEMRRTICCRITRCQLRSVEEQYGPNSNRDENCNTPMNAAQMILRYGCFVPLCVAEFVTLPCWIPCVMHYKFHKREQIQQENYQRARLSLRYRDEELPAATLTNSERHPQASVILYENIAVASPVTDADRNYACASIISINLETIQDTEN